MVQTHIHYKLFAMGTYENGIVGKDQRRNETDQSACNVWIKLATQCRLWSEDYRVLIGIAVNGQG